MTPEDFDRLFDSFHWTVFRFQCLPYYNVGGAEADRVRAFQAGQPRPLRSVATDPWLARMAATTIQGKQWEKAWVVDDPMTDYQRYQVDSHRESQVCGERVHVVPRAAIGDLGGDFWLFDGGTPGVHAALMRYDSDGRYLGADYADADEVERRGLWRVRRLAIASSIPLNEFLAGLVRA